MSIPPATITVYPGGSSRVEGMEQTKDCFKLGKMAESAGKIKERKKKEHPPLRQDVHANGGGR